MPTLEDNMKMIRSMKPDWGTPPAEYVATMRRLWVDWDNSGRNLQLMDLGLTRRSVPSCEIDNPRWMDLEGTHVACLMTGLAGDWYVSLCREFVGIIGRHYGTSTRRLCGRCVALAADHPRLGLVTDGRA